MNTFVLDIRLKRVDGALLRCLGMIERRGFVLQSLTCFPYQNEGLFFVLRAEVSSTRSVETLCKQIEKLWDVDQVRILDNHNPV
jgi:acetolactate synthase II small subunit